MRWMNVRRKARVSVSSLVSRKLLISSAEVAIMSSEFERLRDLHQLTDVALGQDVAT